MLDMLRSYPLDEHLIQALDRIQDTACDAVTAAAVTAAAVCKGNSKSDSISVSKTVTAILTSRVSGYRNSDCNVDSQSIVYMPNQPAGGALSF